MVSRRETLPGRPAVAGNASPEVKGGLLIWLSGADLRTLQKCPRERNKFTGLGGVVLTTAVMAGVSSAFALYTGVKAALYAAIPIGLLWSLAIMNLDRWLVTASPRRDRWFQNLYVTLPRLALALIIGGVISTPLVLWIFQREINAELDVINQQKAVAFQQQLNSDERYKDIPDKEKEVARLQGVVDGTIVEEVAGGQEIANLRAQYKSLDDRYYEAQKQATCERDGTCGTGDIGAGPEYLQKQKVADDLRSERDAVKAQLDAAEAQLKKQQETATGKSQQSASERLAGAKADLERLTASKKLDEDSFAARNRNDRGLLAQLAALSELTSKNGTLRTAYLSLLLFITAIEVLPVLVKFLMNLGPPTLYDRILAQSDQASVATATMALTHEQDLTRREWEHRTRIKSELLDQQMDAWGEQERTKAEASPVQPDKPDSTGLLSRLRSGRRDRSVRNAQSYSPWPEEEPDNGQGGSSSPNHVAEQPWTYDR